MGNQSPDSIDYTVRVLLSDLDDTLFDHQHATRAALAALRETDPRLQQWDLESLKVRHHALLEQFHLEVMAGRLTIDQAREARFSALVGGGEARGLAEAYRESYLADWREVDGAAAVLTAVRAQGVRVVIVTNNIVSEQRRKLDRLGLTSLVDVLITSEEVGAQKPDPRIFLAALQAVTAEPVHAVMLGDAWPADVEGARGVGIRPVWLNRHGRECPDLTVDMLTSLTPSESAVQILLRH
jgi:putative hydrolase of the HAD superfamily